VGGVGCGGLGVGVGVGGFLLGWVLLFWFFLFGVLMVVLLLVVQPTPCGFDSFNGMRRGNGHGLKKLKMWMEVPSRVWVTNAVSNSSLMHIQRGLK